jgi:hypothetical protein
LRRSMMKPVALLDAKELLIRPAKTKEQRED